MDEERRSYFLLSGKLEGHTGQITQVTTTPFNPNMLVSSSRDKTIMFWDLHVDQKGKFAGGRALKSLVGHGHFVSDVVLSQDGQYAVSGSWDKSIRLWDLTTGKTSRQFVSHTKDVLSVDVSADNTKIISGSRDNTVKLWNTLGVCKQTFAAKDEGHTNWVSCVRFSSSDTNPSIVSGGWDKIVKVWNLAMCRLQTNHIGHTGTINTLTVSPDGSLCASGGKDGNANLWDLDDSKHLYLLSDGGAVNALAFSPNRYWLCAASGSAITIWDLEQKCGLDELKIETVGSSPAQCTSVVWSADGNTLFAGYTDNTIRIWSVADWVLKQEATGHH